MSRRLIVVLVVLGLIALGYPAASDEPGSVHLPDLRTLTPDDFVMDVQGDGTRLLRFGNTIWNGGDGPLELRPRHDSNAGITYALQQLFVQDENGNFAVSGERDAGSFEFHQDHNHWHFSDFALYTLRTSQTDGSMGSDEVVVSDKISFCMYDQYAIDPSIDHAATTVQYSGQQCYNTGGENAPQGYSVGWGDEYAWNFVGQSLDVTSVPDGTYWLYSISDPSDLIDETDELNNAAATAVRLEGSQVYVVPELNGQICRPCGRRQLVAGRSYRFRGEVEPSGGADLLFSYRARSGGSWKPVGSPGSRAAFTAVGGGVVPTRDGLWNVSFVAERSGRWALRMRYPSGDGYDGSAVSIPVRVLR